MRPAVLERQGMLWCKKIVSTTLDYEDEFNCSLISIYENGAMSLREIAKREGLSFARIKQIQDKALIKLKKRLPDGEELLASSGDVDYLILSF